MSLVQKQCRLSVIEEEMCAEGKGIKIFNSPYVSLHITRKERLTSFGSHFFLKKKKRKEGARSVQSHRIS